MVDHPAPRFVTSHEAAHYIGLSDSWLRKTRVNGRVDGPPFYREGARAIRYRLDELDEWLAQRRYGGTSKAELETQSEPAPRLRWARPLSRRIRRSPRR